MMPPRILNTDSRLNNVKLALKKILILASLIVAICLVLITGLFDRPLLWTSGNGTMIGTVTFTGAGFPRAWRHQGTEYCFQGARPVDQCKPAISILSFALDVTFYLALILPLLYLAGLIHKRYRSVETSLPPEPESVTGGVRELV